ncbi:hypothetical protein K502DRAFT_361730 [Neoconidiobolus thromboides FSU 785]|nr:hypothetical protein K502DRAFT_361730 [Neoconidiobolus thromboides FSU 785]
MSTINNELLPKYSKYYQDIKLPSYNQVSTKKFIISMNFCFSSEVVNSSWSIKEVAQKSTWFKVYQYDHGIKIKDKKQSNISLMESKIIPDTNYHLKFIINFNSISAEVFKVDDKSYNLILSDRLNVTRYIIIIEKNKHDGIKLWKLMDPKDSEVILALCTLRHTSTMLAELQFSNNLKIHEFQFILISFCQLMSCYYRSFI